MTEFSTNIMIFFICDYFLSHDHMTEYITNLMYLMNEFFFSPLVRLS